MGAGLALPPGRGAPLSRAEAGGRAPPRAGVSRHRTWGWMRPPLPESAGEGFCASRFLQGFVAAASVEAGSCLGCEFAVWSPLC